MTTATLNPALFLDKLREKKLTGYAQFVFAATNTVFLFYSGRLITVLAEVGNRRLHSLDALTFTFERLATQGGKLNVYGLSKALAGSIQALLDGEVLHRGQDLRLVDAKALMAKLKAQRLTGCMRVYTPDVSSLILYKDGAAVGFFHDGSQEIETSATESQRVARLPGAAIDVMASQNIQDIQAYDMLEIVDVAQLWSVMSRRHAAELARLARQSDDNTRRTREELVAKLTEGVMVLAEGYLGKMGRNVVTKAFGSHGGNMVLLENGSLDACLAAIGKSSKLLMGQSKIDEMLNDIRSHVANGIQAAELPL